jgi:acyl-coenzyme A synthetase/AMP-(fatty) acid ligase
MHGLMRRREPPISSIIVHAARQPEGLRNFFVGKTPRRSIPDRVIVAEELPHGATDKILKSELRRLYTE